MEKHRTALVYYGGKGMLARKYPKPYYKKIIEPFAGGAAYSLLYYNNDVTLIDQNPELISAWEFIQNPDLEQLNRIPQKIKPGTKVKSLGSFSRGFEFILRAAANVGCAGKNAKIETITSFGAIHFYMNSVAKIIYWTDKIKHWKFICGSYDDFKFEEATYFFDPPYQNAAGARYKYSAKNINYNKLKMHIKTLNGQIIITESMNSKWIHEFKKNDLGLCRSTNPAHMSPKRNRECFIEKYQQ